MSSEKNDVPAWEQRFRAARVSLPDWADDAPDRSLYVSNTTGTYQVYAWDRATGSHRQVTDRPHGTTDAALSPTAPGSGGSTTPTATSSASGAASRSRAAPTSRPCRA